MFTQLQISQFFPQRHPIYPDVRIIYHYGERFYNAASIDAILSKKNTATQKEKESGHHTKEEQQAKPLVDVVDVVDSSPRSVVSESSTYSHNNNHNRHTQNPGSRSIGKRNQQFYLPDGSVKLMHISVEDRDRTDGEHDEGSDKWYGRYEKEKNTITRTSTEYDLPESVDICEYETLAHFAQEHDKQCWGNDYAPSNTHNVWKNPHYMYYNTVTFKWEPLARLR
jgi:hypothetical protein